MFGQRDHKLRQIIRSARVRQDEFLSRVNWYKLQPALLFLGLCTTLLGGIHSAFAADPPASVRAVIYSDSAAEIFWPRVAEPVVGYAITRNDSQLGVFDALSYFDNTLESPERYIYTVASVESDGTRSAPVSVEIDLAVPGNDTQSGPVTGLRVEIYSHTAAELFWDRADRIGVQYILLINEGTPVITDGTSLYLDSLEPGVPYRVEIVEYDPDTNETSSASKLEFQTTGGRDGTDGPTRPPRNPVLPPPADVRVEIYSSTAAEMFWARANSPGLQYEVSLNGVPLGVSGSTDATSLFLDSLQPGSSNTFRIVKLDTLINLRSEPVILDFTMPGGASEGDGTNPTPPPGGNSPITADNARLMLNFVLDITNDYGHQSVEQALRDLQFSFSIPVAGLTLQEDDPLDQNSANRYRYDCENGGTFVLERTGNAFGDANLNFDRCVLGTITREGSVFISTGSGVDANFDYSDYSEFNEYSDTPADGNQRSPTTINLTGQAGRSATRSFNFVSDYAVGVDYTFDVPAGSQRVTGLQQSSTYDQEQSPPLSFETAFQVAAIWTRGRLMRVETPIIFNQFDLDSGLYSVGQLRITDNQSDSHYIELDADTGEPDTVQITVVEGDAVTSQTLDWADLSGSLPCVATPNEIAENSSNCR